MIVGKPDDNKMAEEDKEKNMSRGDSKANEKLPDI